ncbi:MAG: DUF2807 domain-containing protein [Emcibacter sp.]|nr:DUF2807 domain-containing protein [Emcibacter sp.]
MKLKSTGTVIVPPRILSEKRAKGSGVLVVYASESLDVDVAGSGDVYVYGNPDKVIDRSRKKNHITIK